MHAKTTSILLNIIFFLLLIFGATQFTVKEVRAATVCSCTRDCGTATECTYCVDSVTNNFVSNECLSPPGGSAGSTLSSGAVSCGGGSCSCTRDCGTATECTYCVDSCGNFVSNACKTPPPPSLNCVCTKDCGLPTQCLYCTNSATGAFVSNECGVPSATAQGVCVAVYCNSAPACSGTCSKSCGDGVINQCVYTQNITAPSSFTNCIQVSAPNQPCNLAACAPPLTPWIQTTGGDVHSNININTPGGP